MSVLAESLHQTVFLDFAQGGFGQLVQTHQLSGMFVFGQRPTHNIEQVIIADQGIGL